MRRKLVAFQTILGAAGAYYLRLVWATSHVATEPPNIYEAIDPYLPFIFAMWHGQDGKPKLLNSRYTNVWVKGLKGWRMVVWQSTPIPG